MQGLGIGVEVGLRVGTDGHASAQVLAQLVGFGIEVVFYVLAHGIPHPGVGGFILAVPVAVEEVAAVGIKHEVQSLSPAGRLHEDAVGVVSALLHQLRHFFFCLIVDVDGHESRELLDELLALTTFQQYTEREHGKLLLQIISLFDKIAALSKFSTLIFARGHVTADTICKLLSIGVFHN